MRCRLCRCLTGGHFAPTAAAAGLLLQLWVAGRCRQQLQDPALPQLLLLAHRPARRLAALHQLLLLLRDLLLPGYR